jgi:hypothetical protein
MPWTKTDLNQAEAMVKRAEEIVARQEKIVAEYRRAGRGTDDAEDLLRSMREGLWTFRRYRDMVERELAKRP